MNAIARNARRLAYSVVLLEALGCHSDRSPGSLSATPRAPRPPGSAQLVARAPRASASAQLVARPPEVGRAADLTQIRVRYDWSGLRGREHQELELRVSELSPARVTTLVEALVDLVPSDGIKGCVDHTDDYPSFEVSLMWPEPRPPVVLSSMSNCGNHSPWNAIIEDTLYLQTTGKIGAALLPILHDREPTTWGSGSGLATGNMLVTQALAPAPGVKTANSFRDRYLATIAASPEWRANFRGEAPAEVELFCELAASPRCQRVSGKATVLHHGLVREEVPLELDGDRLSSLEIDAPAHAQLSALGASQLAATLAQRSAAGPLNVHFYARGRGAACSPDTMFVQARDSVARPSPTSASAVGCSMYVIEVATPRVAGEKPPSLVYYPDLELAWVNDAGDRAATESFFRALGASDAEIAGRSYTYLRLDGQRLFVPPRANSK